MAVDLRRRPATSPWALMEQLMDNPWALFTSAAANGGGSGAQQVPLNAWETREGSQVALLAPGAEADALTVACVGGSLTVEGELTFQVPEGAAMIWRALSPSKLRRAVQVPDAIDADHVEGYDTSGVLFLTVPTAEHARPRNIQVKSLAAD